MNSARSNFFRARCAATMLLVACPPLHHASAQSPRLSTVDFGVGVGRAYTNTVFEGSAVGRSLDVLASTQGADTQPSRVLALALNIQSTGAQSLVCRDDGKGGCIPYYPELFAVSALMGWQSRSGVVRVFAGPSLAYLDNNAFGAYARLDLSLPAQDRFALVSFARAQTFAVSGTSPYHLIGAGVGVRLRGRRESSR